MIFLTFYHPIIFLLPLWGRRGREVSGGSGVLSHLPGFNYNALNSKIPLLILFKSPSLLLN